MRVVTIALLLCTLVLVNDVVGQYGYGRRGTGGPKLWIPRFPGGFYPVNTARATIFALFGLSPPAYTLDMHSSLGAWWNFFEGRDMRWRVKFRFTRTILPFHTYECYGNMWWPKGGFFPIFSPFLGFPYTYCVWIP